MTYAEDGDNEEISGEEPSTFCFVCGIAIGSSFLETEPVPVGDKVICRFCRGKMERKGYLNLDAFLKIKNTRRLLSSGRIVGRKEEIEQEAEVAGR